MALPSDFIDELISRNDIVDVVSEYVQLSKKSGSNLFGLCPFHNEKTPSFSVSQDKQIYHCFGCGKGGNVINFIMDIENLKYYDAVCMLAKRTGMQVPDDGTPDMFKKLRSRILALNSDAARFFYSNLSKPSGAVAIEYINKRRISSEMVIKFGMGVAPNEWNSLSDTMMRKGYPKDLLVQAGLSKYGKNGSVYDTFRNRLMFPVIDLKGDVIGFSGRILDDGDPKYLNSPDTPVFQKSKNLFAMNIAKKSKMGMIILAEGNIDVVSLHQAGFDCAVASLGTSLTSEQARLISRYTENVVIVYDSDDAGQKAVQRAISIFDSLGISTKVLKVNDAKDPDEFIKKFGREAFAKLLEKSENHIEYQLASTKNKYDLRNDEERVEYLKEATALLAQVSNSIERDVYIGRVSEDTGVSKDAINSEVKKIFSRNIALQKKKKESRTMRPDLSAQPVDRSIKYDNVLSAVAEEGVIRLFLFDPTLINNADISPDDFTSPFLAKLYKIIKQRYDNGNSISIAAISSELESDEASQLITIMEKPESLANSERALNDYIEKIKTEKLKSTAEKDLMAVRNRLKEKKGLEDNYGR